MITYHVEPWSTVQYDTRHLWNLHWQEVAMNKDKIQLDLDMATYEQYAASGALHCVIARSGGVVVGYHWSVVKPHLHYRNSLCAFTDVYFLHPDHRHGRAGIELFQAAESTLKARGVEKLFTGTKVSLDMGKIFEYLGWTETERLYTKFIGDR